MYACRSDGVGEWVGGEMLEKYHIYWGNGDTPFVV